MAVDNVRHPIKDSVIASNSTYSSEEIEKRLSQATELPEVTAEDAGDVLMVNDDGEWTNGEIVIPQELPTVTSADAGDVLMVNDDGEWTNGEIPAELPAVTSADEGDVLTVNSSGEWVAATPGGGGSAFSFELTQQNGSWYAPAGTAPLLIAALEAGSEVTMKKGDSYMRLLRYYKSTVGDIGYYNVVFWDAYPDTGHYYIAEYKAANDFVATQTGKIKFAITDMDITYT